MTTLEDLLTRLEALVAEMEELEEPARSSVFELLDGIDSLHLIALTHLAEALGPSVVANAQDAHPAVAWLLEAYGVGVDQRAAAEAALEAVRPYIHSHGGEVAVRDVADGIVHLRLSGTCSGCTASAATLTERIEQALREGVPGFLRTTVEEDETAEPHPPPVGPVAVELRSRPA